MSPKKTSAARSTKTKSVAAVPRRKKAAISPDTETTSSVTLHILGGSSHRIAPQQEDFQRTAMYWEYVLRNRIRWAHDPNTAQPVTTRALDALNKLGIDDAKLTEIAASGVVEIEIPFTSAHEEIGWELRVFPWEFMLFTGTAGKRTS